MTFSYALYPTAHSLLNAPIFQLQYIHLTAYSKPTVCLHWIQIDGSKHYIEAVARFFLIVLPTTYLFSYSRQELI